MKKKKIRKRLEKAIKGKQLCKIFTEYDSEAFHFLPIKLSDTLIYLVKDGDADSNGYSIRSLDIIDKVKVEDTVIKSVFSKNQEGKQSVPELDISDWPSLFRCLGDCGKVIIVESEKLAKKEGRYAIGRIEKVGRKQVTIRYYGPDSVWENKRWKIPYEDVTWVTTDSRYTDVLTRYVPESDQAAGAEIDMEDEPEM